MKQTLEDSCTALFVEAWVRADGDRPEAMQALVSQWAPPDAFGGLAAYDAGQTDGLDSTGYFGAVFDGRYVYFVPEMHADLSTHAVVLRYDTHGPFDGSASYAAFDADPLVAGGGFYGGVFDGRYLYFVPRQTDRRRYHSRLLRYDTAAPFKDLASWDTYDIGEEHSQQGAAFDGRYIYFCPGYRGDPSTEDQTSGRVIRYDTRAPFKQPGSYNTVDVAAWFGTAAANFDGGAFDGRYIYFVPLESGLVLRYDTHGAFDDRNRWEAYDATKAGMSMCVGAVFDGRHMYFVPYSHGNVVRYDTVGLLTDPTA